MLKILELEDKANTKTKHLPRMLGVSAQVLFFKKHNCSKNWKDKHYFIVSMLNHRLHQQLQDSIQKERNHL